MAIALALFSVFVERTGPQLVQYGNLCGVTALEPRYQLALKGGFPVAYLFDAPGVSVEGQLSFGEDNLFVGALIADVAMYFATSMLAIFVVSHCWSS
ncbi:hypothetical protein GTP81_16825 [Rugamonas sp. FT107W]|uniref:Uncharacterized protein n=1 Tax=Duganella vulcania TaxID=2692166 RepID=A0A845HPQ0_9BURK|nr:hypothetical protein [Duganella vulcania]MYN18416.1 hypothetical protein [Duganella vulcania]